MSEPILIHPGFHKTGTTYLQNVVFADNSLFRQPWSRGFLYDHIIDPHEFSFDAQAARAAFAAAHTGDAGGQLTVLSEEGLCGNPFNGAREAGNHARKLQSIFADAHILITVRAQPGMLRAVYIQYLKAFGRRSPANFYHPPRYPEFSAFDPDIYQYHRLADCYAALFGQERVLVLPQELLQRNEAAFIKALGDFTGRTLDWSPPKQEDAHVRNISPSPSGVPFLRLGNHFAPSAFNESGMSSALTRTGDALRSIAYRKTPFFRNKSSEFHEAIQKFSGHYGDSNSQLQKYCPVDLRGLGYEIG